MDLVIIFGIAINILSLSFIILIGTSMICMMRDGIHLLRSNINKENINPMNLSAFIKKHFGLWNIIDVKTFDNTCGYLTVKNKETIIKVYFTLHGETHWSGNKVEVDHVEAF